MRNFFPLQLLLTTFAGWVNREQARVVAYLVEENRVLREQLGNRRLVTQQADLEAKQQGLGAAKERALAALEKLQLQRGSVTIPPEDLEELRRRLEGPEPHQLADPRRREEGKGYAEGG